MKKNYINLLILGIILLGGNGCVEFFSQKKAAAVEEKLEYVLSIHPVIKYPKGAQNEVLVTDAEKNKRVWIEAKYAFNSTVIKSITLEAVKDKPGFCSLNLDLTERGEKWWFAMVDNNWDHELAFLVDGILIFTIKGEDLPIRALAKTHLFSLPTPVHESIARRLELSTPVNFAIFSNKEKQAEARAKKALEEREKDKEDESRR